MPLASAVEPHGDAAQPADHRFGDAEADLADAVELHAASLPVHLGRGAALVQREPGAWGVAEAARETRVPGAAGEEVTVRRVEIPQRLVQRFTRHLAQPCTVGIGALAKRRELL